MKTINVAGRRSGMPKITSLTLASALVGLAITTPVFALDQLERSQIVPLLKQGGYVIYIRHATTEKDYADQLTADTNNCSTQRTLSEKGWQEAELIGASFSALNIPAGAVYSSEYCRAWQTAKIAFGTYVKKPSLNFERAEEYTPAQTKLMSDHVTPLLASKPAQGTNTIIVGHDEPFEAATGIYPEPQGSHLL